MLQAPGTQHCLAHKSTYQRAVSLVPMKPGQGAPTPLLPNCLRHHKHNPEVLRHHDGENSQTQFCLFASHAALNTPRVQQGKKRLKTGVLQVPEPSPNSLP